MNYRDFESDTWIRRPITLSGRAYRFVTGESNALGETAFASRGKKALVFKLKDGNGEYFALKVFEKAYAGIANMLSTVQLMRYANIEGLQVCKRTVIFLTEAEQLLEPGLAYSVLMPWVPGQSWYEIICRKATLTQDQCLTLARTMARILSTLEKMETAHTDISSSNVFVEIFPSVRIHLIDVEDMYHSGFHCPGAPPAGSPGYNHPEGARSSYWNQYGDRFAGAIILAEMLAWHRAEIRNQAEEASFFRHTEMCSLYNARYSAMLQALGDYSGDITSLFQRAWTAPTLSNCPTLAEWSRAVDSAQPLPKAFRKLRATAPFDWSSFVRGSRPTLGTAFQTRLLDSHVCIECGQVAKPGRPQDHAPTCSRHTNQFRPLIDPDALPWLHGTYPQTETLFPAALKKSPLSGLLKNYCTECARLVIPPLGIHNATCSKSVAATPPQPKPEVCAECGRKIDGGDARQHGLLCSRHPDHGRLKRTAYTDVMLAPLEDEQAPLLNPVPAFGSPLLPTSFTSIKNRQWCPECKQFVQFGSLRPGHKPGCSRQGT